MIRLLATLSIAAALVTSATAQAMTVQSLLTEGYTIVSVMPSNAGPGIFLQKGDKLIACFVAETPKSPDLATRYCKPVR
jgi:hypothetical protein